ncbi:MAG: single-stranded-DNA-specific exonuclease RecJ [Planctomycetes bacterium]|nr:single-stranded-DNA-specific exonuclease RecJ [Planctomycetota bacterium]
MMLNRDVRSAADVRRFLGPEFSELLPPERLPNAVAAGRRLAAAARSGQKIVIYGDYDVDGITATAILWQGLKLAGANVSFYIPSRLDEGYGLNAEALEAIAAEGGEVVVTVDCGITALEEAQRARQLGLELIITDHHQPRETLPAANLIVHPTIGDDPAANRDLCGAAVALKIAWALAQTICGESRVDSAYRDYLLDATALAALGLVADVVPLTGENRVIASYGLRQLCHTKNIGLQALIEVSGLAGKRKYDDYDVGFRLAPRLNAVGRLGHARLAVELFTRADADRAREIASMLDSQNRQRQSVERAILKQAEELVVEGGFDRDNCHGIVLASPDWHAGVIGIVAARLVERFGRPTVLIALKEGEGQGSGRSVRHFPLHEVLQACERHLVSFGGHAMAVGLRIRADQVAGFTDAFVAEAGRRLTPRDLRPRLELDDEVTLAALTTAVVDLLERMAPFGPGNPRPRLATTPVELVDAPRVVGRDGNHLQFTVRQGRDHRKAIAFGRGEDAVELADHRRLRLAFEPIINEWNGRRSVELKVLDWKWADAE